MAAEGKLELLAILKDKASGPLRKLKGLAGGIGGAMKKGALIGAVAVAAIGVAAVKAFAGFDEAMTKSLAIMGDVTAQQRESMERTARQVAKTTLFSANEAAESYFFLASAGLDAAQSIEALPKVAAFAQAGNFDMALATDLLTDAQSALGLVIRDDVVGNMENMVRVSDVLIKANTLANASAQQFSEALTNKAGAALRDLGKDVEEGVAVLSVFADQGVKGADAGTKFGIVLRDLQTKALANKEEFASLGVSVFDSAGEMRNIADIVGDLEVGLDGMSDAQRKATLLQLGFSDKSVSVVQALLGTSDQIRKYEEGLRSAGDITEEVAGKQLESFSAQLSLLKSGFQDVLITLGSLLVPLLLKLFPLFSQGADALAGFIAGFERFNDPDITSKGPFGFGEKMFVLFRTKVFPALEDIADFVKNDFFPAFKLGVQTVAPLIKSLFTFIVNNKVALIAAITAIGIAILIALGPGAIAVAAIIGLIVLIGVVRANFASWKATVEEFVDAIVAKIEGIPVIGEIFKATVAVIGDKIAALRGFIQGLIDFVTELVAFVKAIFSGDWAAAWDSLKKLAVISLNLFLDFLQLTFLGTIKSILGSLDVWGLIKAGFTGLADLILGAARGMITKLKTAGRVIGAAIKSGLLAALKGGLNVGRGFANAIIRTMNSAIRSINRAIPNKISLPGPIPDVDLPDNPIPLIPTLEHGGRVVETGLAVVHKDEEFSGPGGFRGGITVNGPLLEHHGPLMGNAAEAEKFATLMDSALRRKWRRQSA